MNTWQIQEMLHVYSAQLQEMNGMDAGMNDDNKVNMASKKTNVPNYLHDTYVSDKFGLPEWIPRPTKAAI
jgi:hypothetical protein